MNCTCLTPYSSRFSKSSNTLFQEITICMLNSCLSKILIGFSNYILSTTMLADNYTDKSFLQSFLWSRNSGHIKSVWSCVKVDVPNDWKWAVKYQKIALFKISHLGPCTKTVPFSRMTVHFCE